jgi:hypothetical protein
MQGGLVLNTEEMPGRRRCMSWPRFGHCRLAAKKGGTRCASVDTSTMRTLLLIVDVARRGDVMTGS